MDRYADKIIIALGKNGITGMYNEVKKLVYAHHQNKYGDIFGVYEYNEGTISSSVIYSQAIPQNKKDEILTYLSSTQGINFYADNSTIYVVLDSNYHLDKEQALRLDEFCIKAYRTLIQNQQALFEIIT